MHNVVYNDFRAAAKEHATFVFLSLTFIWTGTTCTSNSAYVPITSFPGTPHIQRMEPGNEANALPTLNSVNTDSFRYRHATCSK